MFTGIVQNLGRVINYTNGKLEISTTLDLSDCKIGSSIVVMVYALLQQK